MSSTHTLLISSIARLTRRSRALIRCSYSLKATQPLWITSCLIALLASGCHAPPPDQTEELIQAMRGQEWELLKGRYLSGDQLATFPLKRALERGDQWVGVKRIRRLDQYLMFDVDLRKSSGSSSKSSESTAEEEALNSPQGEADLFQSKRSESRLRRFTFWVSAPTPAIDPETPENLGPTFKGELGELGALGEIVGWSEPRSILYSAVNPSDLEAPRRFSTHSYRVLSGHQSARRVMRSTLGVLDGALGGAIEPGWSSSISLQNIKWSPLDSRRRGCRKARARWRLVVQSLRKDLSQTCERSLLLSAQRDRYLGLQRSQPQVDVESQGGGRSLRDEQDRALNFEALRGGSSSERDDSTESQRAPQNGVDFGGRLLLQQSLTHLGDQLPPAVVSEAIIIAPDLIRCFQRGVQTWAYRSLPDAQCDLNLTLHFKVSPLNVEESDALEVQQGGE